MPPANAAAGFVLRLILKFNSMKLFSKISNEIKIYRMMIFLEIVLVLISIKLIILINQK